VAAPGSRPAGKLLNYTDDRSRTLQPVVLDEQKQNVNLSGVSVTLAPHQLGPIILERADVVVRTASVKDRSTSGRLLLRTVGPYADQFGLNRVPEGHCFAAQAVANSR